MSASLTRRWLSRSPRVLVFDHFLSAAECHAVRSLVRSRMMGCAVEDAKGHTASDIARIAGHAALAAFLLRHRNCA